MEGLEGDDHQGGWLSKFSATVVVGVAVATFICRHAWIRIQDSRDASTPEEPSTSQETELQCSCGLPAKLRISKTLRNPYRLFYNCPKTTYHHQCEYFHWSDELSANVERGRKEINFLRSECIRLHKKVAYVQSQRDHDRALWERQRSELRSKVQSLQTELDDIKRRIQHLYDLDNMPPFDDSYATNNEDSDGAIDIEIL
ncbi:hypothetical protein KSS87_019064 [Heliosperma pusillum]|nr:hypothetical protein KSS87_019064 [Heliosperma pusillum]